MPVSSVTLPASRLVTEEYDKMSRQLDMEEKLRQQAEIFARQMLLKQKEANRQSLILMQNVGAEAQLLLALEDVAQMTRRLEETKMEHEAKVKDLETQLAERPLPEELARLQATLATAEEGKAHLEQRLLQAEENCASLERKVKALEEGAQPPDTPEESPVVPVPPPPPLPPPTFPAKADPLMALREKKGTQQTKRGKWARGQPGPLAPGPNTPSPMDGGRDCSESLPMESRLLLS
ncbi:shootin-1-like [Crotalus adamanteus]|uniref:Shootin-1-like n=1 Tax=Crotalus adamanteus TaxID=8729 RepID=A0AAW1B8Q6_CROAD